MLESYLQVAEVMFMQVRFKAFIIFCVYTCVKFLVKRKYEIKPFKMLCEFGWILTVLLILKITGITTGDFGTTSVFDGNVQISFGISIENFSIATLLNLILFIPFGFFSAGVLKKLRSKWIYGILIGLIFSLTVEFLQTFIGRFVELEDVLMNTMGAFIGYEIMVLVIKLKDRMKMGALKVE